MIERTEPDAKAISSRASDALSSIAQQSCSTIPDAPDRLSSTVGSVPLLGDVADALSGHRDWRLPNRFVRMFWEVADVGDRLGVASERTVTQTRRTRRSRAVVYWEDGRRRVCASVAESGARLAGRERPGVRPGVAVSADGRLPATLYTGELFDNNVAVDRPERSGRSACHLGLLLSSDEFTTRVRQIDPELEGHERRRS